MFRPVLEGIIRGTVRLVTKGPALVDRRVILCAPITGSRVVGIRSPAPKLRNIRTYFQEPKIILPAHLFGQLVAFPGETFVRFIFGTLLRENELRFYLLAILVEDCILVW